MSSPPTAAWLPRRYIGTPVPRNAGDADQRPEVLVRTLQPSPDVDRVAEREIVEDDATAEVAHGSIRPYRQSSHPRQRNRCVSSVLSAPCGGVLILS